MRATDRILAPVAEATGGAVRWLARRRARPAPGRARPPRFGRGWLGIERNGAYRVLGIDRDRSCSRPGWALLLGAALTAWWREGRS